MTTLTEIEPEDSGVSSSGATPESQTISSSSNSISAPEEKSESTKEATIPEPTKESTPELVKESTPEAAKESSPESAKEATPESAKEATPESAKEATPESAKEATPESAKEATPEPVKEATPEPVKEAIPKPKKEVTPEPTIGINKTVIMKSESNKSNDNKKEVKSSNSIVSVSDLKKKPVQDEIDDDEDEEDLDETILERICGLTEMFPEGLRSTTSSLVSGSISLVKNSYSMSRKAVWFAVSTSVILFAPVMFELERLNVEEMMKQDRNRLVLGPGSAMSGAPGAGGLAPPPPAR